MNPNQFNYTSPAMRLSQMEHAQMYGVPQTIQNLQPPQPQVQCFFCGSAQDLGKLQSQPGVVYIGINKASEEIYVRKLNMDGIIELETYKKSGGQQEPTELKAIMAKLENLESVIKGGGHESNAANVNATGNVGADAK